VAQFDLHDRSSIGAGVRAHAGPLGPLKTTKKPVAMHGLDFMVVKGGTVASGSSYWNSLEPLGQAR
jgi:hypothetical protein